MLGLSLVAAVVAYVAGITGIALVRVDERRHRAGRVAVGTPEEDLVLAAAT